MRFIVEIWLFLNRSYAFQTRMQSLSCGKQHEMGIFRMLSTMMKEEGMFRPIRGVSAMVAGAGPAHAMYFGCLETGKKVAENFKMPLHIGDGTFFLG